MKGFVLKLTMYIDGSMYMTPKFFRFDDVIDDVIKINQRLTFEKIIIGEP